MALLDIILTPDNFTLQWTRGNLLGVKGLRKQIRMSNEARACQEKSWKLKFYIWKFVYRVLQVPQSIT